MKTHVLAEHGRFSVCGSAWAANKGARFVGENEATCQNCRRGRAHQRRAEMAAGSVTAVAEHRSADRNAEVNAEVTIAILSAEEKLRDAIAAWQRVERAERVIAVEPSTKELERSIAERGVTLARRTIDCLVKATKPGMPEISLIFSSVQARGGRRGRSRVRSTRGFSCVTRSESSSTRARRPRTMCGVATSTARLARAGLLSAKRKSARWRVAFVLRSSFCSQSRLGLKGRVGASEAMGEPSAWSIARSAASQSLPAE